MKQKEANEMKELNLKNQIKMYKKKEKIKQFDRKHPIIGGIGRFGSIAGKGIGKFSEKISRSLTPQQQKVANANKKKLSELLKM